MNDILNKLYYGEINPSKMPPPATKRYNENLNNICSIENKLLELYPDCRSFSMNTRTQYTSKHSLNAKRTSRDVSNSAHNLPLLFRTLSSNINPIRSP